MMCGDSVARLMVLVAFVASVTAYTDPAVTPATLEDEHGNKADISSVITWADLPAGKEYKFSEPAANPKTEGFLDLVRKFTIGLQPNDIPYDMITGLLDGSQNIMDSAQDLALYFAGFAVCLVIGLLFLIIMPCVCCCFCCCRLCGKCGGKRVRPYPDPKEKCRCTTFTILLTITTATICTGGVMVFFMDEQIGNSLEYAGDNIGNNMDDISTFLTNIVNELEYSATEGFEFAADVVKRDLNNIGAILGVDVKQAFNDEAGVDDAIQSIIDMDTAMDVAEEDMSAVNTSQVVFTDAVDAYLAAIQTIKTDTAATQGNAGCAASCQALDPSSLTSGVDPSALPDITPNLISVRVLQEKDLSQSAKNGSKDFEELPDKIKTDTQHNVDDMKTMMDDFHDEISSNLGSLDALTDSQDTLTSQGDSLNGYLDMLTTYDAPRSYGFYALSGFIFLICLLFFVGLLLGCCGFKAGTDPTKRSKTAHHGGQFLMAGSGFSFIFSYLLMILVFLTFLIGAPVYRFICQPLLDPEYKIFTEFLDKPDGPLGEGYFLGGTLLQDNTIPLTISGVLIACEKNEAAYKALMMDNIFDINSVTNYKEDIDIENELSNLDSDMSTIEILSDDTKDILTDFKDAMDIDYNAYHTELAKSIIDANDLETLAVAYEAAVADNGNSLAVRTELQTQANEIRAVKDNHLVAAETEQSDLKTKVDTMERSSSNLPDAVDDVIAKTERAEQYVQVNGSDVVARNTKAYGNRILGIIDSYVDNVVSKVNNDVGQCQPLFNVYQSLVKYMLCDGIILSLNGFWFSLGWCAFFMLPAIVFGVRLAKYLRIMDPTKTNRLEGRNKVGPQISPPPSYRSDVGKAQRPPKSTTLPV